MTWRQNVWDTPDLFWKRRKFKCKEWDGKEGVTWPAKCKYAKCKIKSLKQIVNIVNARKNLQNAEVEMQNTKQTMHNAN